VAEKAESQSLMKRSTAAVLLLVIWISGCTYPGMVMDPGASGVDGSVVQIVLITPQLIVSQRDAQIPARPRTLEPVQTFDPYRIGPRDIIAITVWEHPQLTIPAGQFRDAEGQGHRVSESGTLFYPYVGEIRAAGLTAEELRRELTKRLSQFITNPQLDVRVAAYRSQRAYVVGEVQSPGVQPVTDIPLTVAEAISLSGGPTPGGDLSSVTVARGNIVIRLDLLAMYERGDAAQNILLHDGDVLSVPQMADHKVFVMGEVLRPASVQMRRRGMTLAEALGEVGGPNQITANPGR
jgi:polysaccharide biosynthesis/export protein